MVIFHSYVKLPEGNNQHFLMGLWEKKLLFPKESPQKTMVVNFKSLQPGKPTVRCMEYGWPTAKWLQSLVEHWRNLPPLSTSILEWISQEISDAASAEYQVELAADAMEDESLPKKNLVKHGESWWKDVKAAVLGCRRCFGMVIPIPPCQVGYGEIWWDPCSL